MRGDNQIIGERLVRMRESTDGERGFLSSRGSIAINIVDTSIPKVSPTTMPGYFPDRLREDFSGIVSLPARIGGYTNYRAYVGPNGLVIPTNTDFDYHYNIFGEAEGWTEEDYRRFFSARPGLYDELNRQAFAHRV